MALHLRLRHIGRRPPPSLCKHTQRSVNQMRRIYGILASCCGALFILVASIAFSLVYMHALDAEEDTIYAIREEEATVLWRNIFTDVLVGAVSATYTLAGFLEGQIHIVSHIGDDRKKIVALNQYPEFNEFAPYVNTSAKFVTCMYTAPAGIVAQLVPDTPGKIYRDLFVEPFVSKMWPSAYQTMKSGQLAFVGPRNGYDDASNWEMEYRLPVYTEYTRSPESFWGFVCVVIDVQSIVYEGGIHEAMVKMHMDYMLYSSSAMRFVNIQAAYPSSIQDDPFAFLRRGAHRRVAPNHDFWYVNVVANNRYVRYTARSIALVVVFSVVGSIVLLAIAIALVLFFTREYHCNKNAPRRVPFATMTIGPSNASTFSGLAATALGHALDNLSPVLQTAMKKHCAYKIQQMHPYTSSYVLESVESAVHMAFSVIEELQSRPIDEPLKRLLGEDGQLLLSYAVHWCTDAIVTTDATVNVYRYEGQDIRYTERLSIFASPNMVTISQQAKAVFTPSSSSTVEIKLFNSVYLRGVAGRQDLFVVTDTTSRRLREAAEGAVLHMQRARELQCQLREENSSRSLYGSDLSESSHMLNERGSWMLSRCASASAMHDTAQNSLYDALSNFSAGQDYQLSRHSNNLEVSLRTRRGLHAEEIQHAKRDILVDSDTESLLSSIIVYDGTPALVIKGDEGRVMICRPSLERNALAHGGDWATPLIVPSSLTAPLATRGIAKFVRRATPSSPTSVAGKQWVLAAAVATPELTSPVTPCCSQPGSSGASKQTSSLSSLASTQPNVRGQNQGTRAFHVQLATTTLSNGSTTTISNSGSSNASTSWGPSPKIHGKKLSLQDQPASQQQLQVQGSSVTHFLVPPSNPFAGRLFASPSEPSTPAISNPEVIKDEGTIGNPLRVYCGILESGELHVVPGTSPMTPPFAAELSVPTMATTPNVLAHPQTTLGVKARSDTPPSHPHRHNDPFTSALVGDACTSVFATSFPNFIGTSTTATMSFDCSTVSRRHANSVNSTSGGGTVMKAASRPIMAVWLDTTLRAAFEQRAVTLDVSYDSVRVIVYFFYVAFKLLFRPLTAQERTSIYKRLVVIFGVPQQDVLENLAACCAVRYLQQHDYTMSALWESVK